MIIRRKLKDDEENKNVQDHELSFFDSNDNSNNSLLTSLTSEQAKNISLINPHKNFKNGPFTLKSMQDFLIKWTVFKNKEHSKNNSVTNSINSNWEYYPKIFTTFSFFFTSVALFSFKYHIPSFFMVSSKLALVTAILAIGSFIYKHFRASIFYHDSTFENTQLFNKYLLENADENSEVSLYVKELFKPENKDFWNKQITWYMQQTDEKDFDLGGTSFSKFHIPQALESQYGTPHANVFILGLISHKNNLLMQRIKGILDELK